MSLTFSDLVNQKCNCDSSLPLFFICTKRNCPKNGPICGKCLYFHHSTHASFCIPISLFRIDSFSKCIDDAKEYKTNLDKAKVYIESIFNEETQFFGAVEKMEDNKTELLGKLNLIPKYDNPPFIREEHIISGGEINSSVLESIYQHHVDMYEKITNKILEIKPSFFKEKTIAIAAEPDSYRGTIFSNVNVTHILKFVMNTKEKDCYLRGLGFDSRVFSEIRDSSFKLVIRRMDYEQQAIIDVDPKPLVFIDPKLIYVNFVKIKPIKLIIGVDYEIYFERKTNVNHSKEELIIHGGLKVKDDDLKNFAGIDFKGSSLKTSYTGGYTHAHYPKYITHLIYGKYEGINNVLIENSNN